jgi:hypothetical protein
MVALYVLGSMPDTTVLCCPVCRQRNLRDPCSVFPLHTWRIVRKKIINNYVFTMNLTFAPRCGGAHTLITLFYICEHYSLDIILIPLRVREIYCCCHFWIFLLPNLSKIKIRMLVSVIHTGCENAGRNFRSPLFLALLTGVRILTQTARACTIHG